MLKPWLVSWLCRGPWHQLSSSTHLLGHSLQSPDPALPSPLLNFPAHSLSLSNMLPSLLTCSMFSRVFNIWNDVASKQWHFRFCKINSCASLFACFFFFFFPLKYKTPTKGRHFSYRVFCVSSLSNRACRLGGAKRVLVGWTEWTPQVQGMWQKAILHLLLHHEISPCAAYVYLILSVFSIRDACPASYTL